jgi:hypothetical protein
VLRPSGRQTALPPVKNIESSLRVDENITSVIALRIDDRYLSVLSPNVGRIVEFFKYGKVIVAPDSNFMLIITDVIIFLRVCL